MHSDCGLFFLGPKKKRYRIKKKTHFAHFNGPQSGRARLSLNEPLPKHQELRSTPRGITLLVWGHDSAACKIQPVTDSDSCHLIDFDRDPPKKVVPPALLLFRLLSPIFFPGSP
jgi:hypothetical protein